MKHLIVASDIAGKVVLLHLADESIAQIAQVVADRLRMDEKASPGAVRNKLGLISREELAAATDRTVRALKTDAIRRVGPPPVVIGKQVFYRLTDVQDFFQAEAKRRSLR